MSNVQSYNALIDRFKAFASGHFILKSFSHGQIDTADLEKFTEYPFMHVVPSNVTYAKGTKTFSFQIVLADLPRDKDDKVEFQREVLSDLQRIAEDLVAEITNHRVLFGDLITVQNVSLEPFLEEFHNTLTGWTVSLELLVPYYWDACSIPAEWNDMFESSTGGTGSILSFVDSITRDENGNVSLVNDEATPAPNYYYGTNDEGVRGWYLLTDEVGLTCATIGTCQTIIDIESAIDDLQTEIALKANTADLGAVAFSNDYNDLDNKPTIPAAQVNSDWNATSGVAEILNKPSLPATVGDMLKSVYDTDVDGVVDSAERIQIVVRNITGSTLTKGQIVYLSGATGNRPNAVLAQANAELTSSKTIGMVIADIANNADGQVAVNGTLHDLDTSAFTAGDTLWLSATTAGGMVANTPPSEPNHTVFIGYVARSHPNLGRIVLAIQNGYELDELHGVQITTPANNEVLTYESSTSLWKNKTVATALGYTPVPTTRSITINGTTQDLSADRTFTIATGLTVGTTPITSGTVGRVLFEGTGNVLQESANLTWDNTNGRLSIGNNISIGTLSAFSLNYLLFSALTTNQGISANFSPNGTPTGYAYNFQFAKSSTSNNNALLFIGGGSSASGNSANKHVITTSADGTATGQPLVLRVAATGQNFGSVSDHLTIFPTGNVVIQGSTSATDAGYKLDVNGTARVSGLLTASASANITGILNVSAQTKIGTTVYSDGSCGLILGKLSGTTAARGFLASDTNYQDFGFVNTNIGAGNINAWTFGQRQDTYFGNALGSFQIVGAYYNNSGTGSMVGGGFRVPLICNPDGTIILSGAANSVNGNVLIGGTTNAASGALQIESTTKGFLPPRMTTTQKNAIASPAAGLVVYDTTLGKLCVRGASAWETITSI